MSAAAVDTAPDGPRLVYSHPGEPFRHSGELVQLVAVIRNALALIRQCLRIAASVIWQRIRAWFEDTILHSLTSAWVICGIGWGGFILLLVLQLAR